MNYFKRESIFNLMNEIFLWTFKLFRFHFCLKNIVLEEESTNLVNPLKVVRVGKNVIVLLLKNKNGKDNIYARN